LVADRDAQQQADAECEKDCDERQRVVSDIEHEL
jgi:hypothetical protein